MLEELAGTNEKNVASPLNCYIVSEGSLLAISCRPHHFGDFVLLTGDAAHAMVPFYGQGMNCGFEDCLVLSESLDACNDDIRE
ncbi:hypothetical protein OESDEN_10866 [Oesophagostomum dentatum]|uniref:FAD-binding domain-containing protein n=1 Tax=Oesophagostomum dentatum TaxID=61180 RepID=A0A0B1SWG7_OESDE|nr:hypothetical protein OESDEN_10866 [Oesophagostomum dentatum]